MLRVKLSYREFKIKKESAETIKIPVLPTETTVLQDLE